MFFPLSYFSLVFLRKNLNRKEIREENFYTSIQWKHIWPAVSMALGHRNFWVFKIFVRGQIPVQTVP
jgi:hypothetical protein